MPKKKLTPQEQEAYRRLGRAARRVLELERARRKEDVKRKAVGEGGEGGYQ